MAGFFIFCQGHAIIIHYGPNKRRIEISARNFTREKETAQNGCARAWNENAANARRAKTPTRKNVRY